MPKVDRPSREKGRQGGRDGGEESGRKVLPPDGGRKGETEDEEEE